MNTSLTVPPIGELQAPPSWRTVDFISDLHLNADEPATFSAWQHYLQATPADAVFILGDLFEVWAGDDAINAGFTQDPAHPAHSAGNFEYRCACTLRQASSRLALFFMHGNRDFLAGQALMAFCHASLLDDPAVLGFAGQRWLLSHGDALCLDDRDYMQFRRQVRSNAWQDAFLAKPLAERQVIARELRRQSEARKTVVTDYADVDASAARQWLAAANARTLIHGHTHKPAVHDLGGGFSRVVLSDWDANAQPPRADVLRLTDGGLQRLALVSAGALAPKATS
ncbi:UDP-2,3-diacylglucosamine diphosphatase [Polaromonas sp.]|uniref:UDP-2,3-diacylglucosamine diphosphatase n=1 Tax=Polaromonas sp. TaxID=1869339 RepID=UPI0025FEE34D|nr:UDP-2,3-diacylglucosamine diphosphatase [Polaromonas sp.]